MAKIDDLVTQIASAKADIGSHLDALDASISTEITNAQTAITNALKTAGATDAQVQVAIDAMTDLDTSIGTHIDGTKTKVDAAFPAAPTP